MSCSLSSQQIEGVTAFHGHWCPGLAITCTSGTGGTDLRPGAVNHH